MNINVDDVIKYIDEAIESRDHGDSFWINENGRRCRCDVGYGLEWWEIVKEELIRVFHANL